jgi:hypothetical protein
MKLKEIYEDVTWIDESLLDEDYPTRWDADEFKSLTSFAARKRYADNNLQKIKAGSGRIVYKIDNEKVLKLSKNKKGVAQTQTEIDWGQDWFLKKSGVLAEIFSFDENALWVEMELARKLTKSNFKRIIGIDFDVFGSWLIRAYELNNGRKSFTRKPSEQEEEFLWENEFTREVMEVMINYSMPAGDLDRVSSYGIVRNDEVVIVDYGLSGDVYNTYYT